MSSTQERNGVEENVTAFFFYMSEDRILRLEKVTRGRGIKGYTNPTIRAK